MHKFFSTLFLLFATTLNVYADYCTKDMRAGCISGTMKEAGELTTDIFEAARPDVLMCMPSDAGAEAGDLIGKVIPGTEPDSFVCAYPRLLDTTVLDTQYTANFRWLNSNYEHLATWLSSFAHIDKNENGYHYASRSYYVFKNRNRNPGHLDICVQSTVGKGFEFGYETVTDSGEKSCGVFVGALYFSPFFRPALNDQSESDEGSNKASHSAPSPQKCARCWLSKDEGSNKVSDAANDEDDFCSKCESPSFHGDCPGCICTVEQFSPACHLCSGDGCTILHCSAFTTWDNCPAGSSLYEHIVCPGMNCPAKPVCSRKHCHKKPE
ncbi:hypothetical protein [Endozoicomonas sp. 4G]|uniref:hypothetical protein n=1 Tax=Endozoicomonas sp. 4G TaxID=2872754 RepID=UPI0020785796|nr:hypothetical protein [Endozoicomonas sp. 4G]